MRVLMTKELDNISGGNNQYLPQDAGITCPWVPPADSWAAQFPGAWVEPIYDESSSYIPCHSVICF